MIGMIFLNETLTVEVLRVSGFTALCEKFSMSSKNGTDKLTKTLNGYMGQLAQEIINFDGDIMKYAGNTFVGTCHLHSAGIRAPD